jgi:hypothetical protein
MLASVANVAMFRDRSNGVDKESVGSALEARLAASGQRRTTSPVGVYERWVAEMGRLAFEPALIEIKFLVPRGGIEPSGFAQTGYAGTSLCSAGFFDMRRD